MLTLIWCPFHPHVTAVAHKRPQSFCQKCRWQVTSKHADALDPTKPEWADYAAILKRVPGNLSGNIQPQSSQPLEPLWTDPGTKERSSVGELISTSKKKKKKVHAGNAQLNILPESSQVRKKPPPPL